MEVSGCIHATVTLRPGENRSTGEPQSKTGRFGEDKNLLSMPGIEPRFV
jgi:hypothetical protein